MIIQCPRCSTRWRVGDPSATDNPTFKCGRCHQVFPQFPGAPPPAERGGGKARSAPPAPDNLEFIFPRRGAAAGEAGSVSQAPDTIAPLRDIVHDPPRAALGAKARRSAAASSSPRDSDTPPVDAAETRPVDAGDGAPTSDPPAVITAPTIQPSPQLPPDADERVIDRDTLSASGGDDFALCDDELSQLLDEDVRAPERRAVTLDEDVIRDDGDDAGLAEDVLGLGRDDDASGDTTRARDADDDVLADIRSSIAPNAAARVTDTAVVHRDAPLARVLDMEAMMSASARIRASRAATRLLVVLVAAFALLALFVRANPERAEAWLARIPLIGGRLAAEPALRTRITLAEVQGGYQQLRTGRRIFVISGKAINNSPLPVERIEVQGELYTATGAVTRKVISTGNRTTLKLRDLSESEIALLQNLDAREAVAPGGSVEFTIVFLEPPRDLREFSSRVLTARSTGRGSSPPDQGRNRASVG